MNLYITADRIGIESGGGKVTHHEYMALKELGPAISIANFPCTDPFQQDKIILAYVSSLVDNSADKFVHAHCYAGCLSQTVAYLKSRGVLVTYTAAAHDVNKSRNEHFKLGWPFDYPHLNNPNLWEEYLKGYQLADVVVCPSKHSKEISEVYGCKNVKIIPHGVDIPETTEGLPEKFTVGYLGASGADKGLVYLLQAWNKLNYKDSTLLMAGAYNKPETMQHMVDYFAPEAKSTIKLLGWVNSPSELYNQCSVYIQPSITEGFGIEVLEAMAHARLTLSSNGAGACDVLPPSCVFEAGNIEQICQMIDKAKNVKYLEQHGLMCRLMAKDYTWDKIRAKYVDLWRSMI